jgi:hypothetical protein
MTTPDYKALCAELVGAWEAKSDLGFSDFWHSTAEIVDRARAALAVEAVGPSDEELLDAADDADMDRFDGERSYPDGTVIKEGCWEAWDHQVLAFASTILARWGRPGSAPRDPAAAIPLPEP